jgi:hypothetical protein
MRSLAGNVVAGIIIGGLIGLVFGGIGIFPGIYK